MTLNGLIVNTTQLHQELGLTGAIGPEGTTWTTKNGTSYTCIIQGGQEVFIGDLLLPASRIMAVTMPTRPHSPTHTPPRDVHNTPYDKPPAPNLDDIPAMLRHIQTYNLSRPAEHALRIQLAHLGCVTTKGENDQFLALHCRLGHRSVRDTLATAHYMQLDVGRYAQIVCDTCQQAKQSRRHVPRQPTTANKHNVFESWHVDVWGPHRTRSLFGAHRYALNFIDAATRTAIPIFLPSVTAVSIAHGIDQFAEVIAEYLHDAKEHTIKITMGPRVITDSAAYFKTRLVQASFKKHGLHHHYYTPPYCQAMNGLIERWHGTIASSMNAMLQSSGLPQSLWTEAYRHATYIYDQLPHSATGISPREARTGHRPNAADLYIWGSKCWCWIPNTQRRKGERRGKPGHYVGHHPRSNSYLVWTKDKGGKDILTNAYHVIIDDRIPDKILQGVIPLAPDDIDVPELHEEHANAILPYAIYSVNDIMGITDIPYRDITYYSYRAACRDPTWGKYFNNTLDDEVGELIRMNALSPIALATVLPNEVIHPSTCIYTIKASQDGSLRGKCRLVFSGKSQRKGIDFDLKSSHQPRWATIRLHLAIAPKQPQTMSLCLIDIKKAYVRTRNYTPDGHRVIIKLPIDATHCDDSGIRWQYMQVNNALYGQVNAGYLWQQCLWNWLRTCHWHQGADRCSWTRATSRIVVWTDDITFRGTTEEQEAFVKEINAKFPGCKVSDGTRILGHNVRTHPNGSLTIDGTDYIKEAIKKHACVAKCTTPLPAGATPHRTTIDPHSPQRTRQYQQLLGTLSYIATTTRPDIAFAVSALGQVAKNPSHTNVKHAHRTLGHLNRTSNFSLQYNITSGTNSLTGYVDASYADSLSHRSQTGYIIFLNDGPVSWRSKCQHYTALSTQEAEVVAACDAIREIQYIRDILASWHTPNAWHTIQDQPTVLFEDNEAAITFFETGLITSRNKHFATKLEHIRRLISEDHMIELQHISTDNQRADILTKALANAKQQLHTDKMLQTKFHAMVAQVFGFPSTRH
eukprot:m.75724 g.75724  ORF g.75724 m.75724 type:complete len:1030 (+) comp16183_c0_seq2:5733-8822(+)